MNILVDYVGIITTKNNMVSVTFLYGMYYKTNFLICCDPISMMT